MTVLPQWPGRTIAVLCTVDEGAHAIPVSAPVRADDRTIRLSLHHQRESLRRLRRWPEVALLILAGDDVAFTARGRARVIEEPMAVDADYVAVEIDVDHVDDHRSPAFRVTGGVDREWDDDAERMRLGARVRSLTER